MGIVDRGGKAGFTRQQAEAQAEALRGMIEDRISTKQDLRELELRLKYDLTIRLGGIVAACTMLPLLVR